MARRPPHGSRHGHRPHRREPVRPDGQGRPAGTGSDAAVTGSTAAQEIAAPVAPSPLAPADPRLASTDARQAVVAAPVEAHREASPPGLGEVPSAAGPPPVAADASGASESAMPGARGRGPGWPGPDPSDRPAGCTAAQLRRFIKSRAWVPMHELRRRFAINGGEDDVSPVDLTDGRIFVGLPDREGRMLGELLRSGEVGYELSLDPASPIVIGVYPMRPVTRA